MTMLSKSFIALAVSLVSLPVHASEQWKADASKYISAEKLKPSAGVKRIAITSCNVLFAMKSSANAETQRGFGDSTQRIEARVSTTYELQGIDPSGFQPLTEHLCNVAAESFRTAGFEVLTAEQMAASPEFAKLHATGQPAPYAYARAGTSYMTYAPAGQQIVDSVYLTKSDSMFSGFKAMSTDGPMFIEARLAKALQASPVHVNLVVDFARLEGNTPTGLLGRFGGSDSAKVDSKVEMSLNGFFTMVPESRIDCSSGFCQGANDASLVARITSKAPLMGGNSMIREVADIKTDADRADELAGNIIGGLAALVGSGGKSYKTSRYGVMVDPVAFKDGASRLTQQFIGMGVALMRP